MKPKARVLVCGGRDFGSLPPFDPPYVGVTLAELQAKAKREKEYVAKVLDAALRKYDIEVIIHGAARGADRLAGLWATANNIDQIAEPANWLRDKKAAGPIRNAEMLKLNPTLVIAFPGGSGTRDMVKRSRAAGVRVIEVPAL